MTDCDVLVMGAGPAGSVASTLLARRGLNVCLVEKKAFPRRKVCGACLSRFAVERLRSVGLDAVLRNAIPLSSFQLAAQGRAAYIPLDHGCSISRAALDGALVEQAVAAGVNFLDETTATLGPAMGDRVVSLMNHGQHRTLLAKSVIVATGLSGAAFRHDPELQSNVTPGALIGAGTELTGPMPPIPQGRIVMATHRAGYVGLVRTEDRVANIAAALDRHFVTQHGGIGPAAQEVVDTAGLNGIALEHLPWAGTPPLTRRPSALASQRVFLVGDAAGYVEPFTGEGIGWAVASAIAVVPFVVHAVARWSDSLASDWSRTYRKMIGRRQRLCRVISAGLKSPLLVDVAVRILQPFPGAARPVIQHLAAQ